MGKRRKYIVTEREHTEYRYEVEALSKEHAIGLVECGCVTMLPPTGAIEGKELTAELA